MNKLQSLQEGTGALKVLNAITDRFMTPNGDILIPRHEWLAFVKPYTAKPK